MVNSLYHKFLDEYENRISAIGYRMANNLCAVCGEPVLTGSVCYDHATTGGDGQPTDPEFVDVVNQYAPLSSTDGFTTRKKP